jgi:hybrid cluster-associated redox disulfide protein
MIDKNMSIEDIVRKFPQTVLIFEAYGLGCAGCQAALFENIRQGAEVHGISVEDLVDDLNKAVAKQ